MTNYEMISCHLFIDDVTLDNRPPEVIRGTHKGPLYSHWHNDVFTGSVSEDVVENHWYKIFKCTGSVWSVCLMHIRLIRGIGHNLSNVSHRLYITTYNAEDAIEYSPNHLPSIFTHERVRGEPSGKVRCTSFYMLLPEVPKDTSFFSQQASVSEN